MDTVIEVNCQKTIISVDEVTSEVSTVCEEVTIIEAAQQGIQGPPGVNLTPVIAGENINAFNIVYFNPVDGKVYKAENTNLASSYSIVGITTSAVTAGQHFNLLCFGATSNDTWNWSGTATLFVGADGQPTQTAPTSGYMLKIGYATSPTSMFFDPLEPITLT